MTEEWESMEHFVYMHITVCVDTDFVTADYGVSTVMTSGPLL